MRWILSAVALFAATSAQAAVDPIRSQGVCPAVIQFIEAAAPENGLRTAVFYPVDIDAGGPNTSLAMDSTPHDDAADVFYEKVAARILPDGLSGLAREMGECVRGGLLRGGDFRFVTGGRQDMRGFYQKWTTDYRTHRDIEIEASRDVCPEALRKRITRLEQVCLRVKIKGK